MAQIQFFLLFCLIGGHFPPLDGADQERLSCTVDGRDSLDEGFAALVENCRGWEQSNTNVFDDIALEKLIANPTLHRGVETSVSGIVEQRSTLPPPWDSVEEWFVRDFTGVPLVLFVVGETQFDSKIQMKARARFYKTMQLTGRDGKTRTFAAFVTSIEAVKSIAFERTFFTPLVFVPVVCVGGVVVFLLNRTKSKRPTRVRTIQLHANEVILAAEEAATDLPDDPAEALALMHESAEEVL
ncbi:MAG: hypothetical protein QGI78_02300 [Phycisphaerales bacterium]|jgi:hypothetical protein|nr:hypothetical protein [Phycisphaerales bacterium]